MNPNTNQHSCGFIYFLFLLTLLFHVLISSLAFADTIFETSLGITKEAPVHSDALQYLEKNDFNKVIDIEKKHLRKNPSDLQSYLVLALAYLGKGEEKMAQSQASFVEKENSHYGAEIYRSMGRYFLLKKRYYKANEYFDTSLLINENPTTFNLKASVYLAQGRVGKAKQYFEKTLATEPEYINLSRIYLVDNDYAKAIQFAEKAIEQFPDKIGAYILLGTANLLENNLPQAKVAFTNAGRLGANPEIVHYYLGLIHLAQNQYDDALKKFSMLTGNMEAHINRAVVFHMKNELDEAEKEAIEAIKINPTDFLGHIVLGNIYISKGNIESADKEYKLSGTLYHEFTLAGFTTAEDNNQMSSNQAAAFSLANIFYRSGMLQQTIRVIQAVYSESKDPFLLMTEARAETKLKHFNRAKALFKEALKLHANLITPYIALADIEAQNSNFKEAIGYYEKAVKIHPEESGLYFDMGDYYLSMNNINLAVTAYITGLKYAPQSAYAQNQLAWILSEKKKDFINALSYARNAHKTNPYNVSISDTLGWIYYRLEKYEEAYNIYVKIMDASVKDPTIYYHAGRTFQKLEKNKEARMAYEKALNISDEFLDMEDTKTRFKDLSSL